MGAVLLAGGAKGKRSALLNSRILIYQASAVFQGTASDIDVQAREILRMNARLQEMMAADTGQTVERVGHDINRDYWMSAAEAVEYGVVDLVVEAGCRLAGGRPSGARVQHHAAAPTSLSTGGR
jgi:ATP-dependent Clp protease protease subunit